MEEITKARWKPETFATKGKGLRTNQLDLVERVAALEADLAALTKDYQQEFEKINELMGVMVDKLAEHDARIKSLEHPK